MTSVIVLFSVRPVRLTLAFSIRLLRAIWNLFSPRPNLRDDHRDLLIMLLKITPLSLWRTSYSRPHAFCRS